MLPYKGLKYYICKKYNNINKIIIEEKKRRIIHIMLKKCHRSWVDLWYHSTQPNHHPK